MRIYCPESPLANKSGTLFEHRLIMAEHLGRPLFPDETVHHKNTVRHDNRLKNLELWVKGHPTGARVEDMVKWAKEILSRYHSD